MNQDNRYKELEDWLSNSIDQPIKSIVPASTDASFRSYFRVFTENRNTYIAVDAPPEYENDIIDAVGDLLDPTTPYRYFVFFVWSFSLVPKVFLVFALPVTIILSTS